MNDDTGRMTAEEARRSLDAADAASIATPADRGRLEKGLIGIGVAVGALVVALRATVGNSEAPSWFRLGGLVVVVALYLVGIAAAVVAMRRASAAPRGFTLRYNLGLGVTMLLYAGYVMVQAGRGDDAVPWEWAWMAALVVMTPALLAASSISRLALR